MQKDGRIELKVDPFLHNYAKELAKRRHKRVSDIYNDALMAYYTFFPDAHIDSLWNSKFKSWVKQTIQARLPVEIKKALGV